MRTFHGKLVFPIKWRHEGAQKWSSLVEKFWAPSWHHLMGKTGKTSFPWSARIGPKPGNSKPSISITLIRQLFARPSAHEWGFTLKLSVAKPKVGQTKRYPFAANKVARQTNFCINIYITDKYGLSQKLQNKQKTGWCTYRHLE